ncbi:MAG: hypothetical protein IJ105_03390 [Bacilli bacterium]|nr:hypothetical protein [Bacilli bacterium]
MDENKVIDFISKINRLFRLEWFEYNPLELDIYDQEKEIENMFKNGNCAIYAELLYDLLKNNGAVVGKSNDHVFIKLFDRYYDIASGFRDNKEELQESVDKYGFDSYNLEDENDREKFEDYKQNTGINKNVESLLNTIKEDILKPEDFSPGSK